MKFSKKALSVAMMSGVLVTGQAYAQEWNGDAKDAWIDGKLEASYLINSELNNFDINTDVDAGNVVLTGTVKSEVHKELAEAIAVRIDDVNSVDNQLTVDDGMETVALGEEERDFGTVFYDLTTTARLKTAYAVNSELKATSIGIDTRSGIVTLEGEVASNAEKMLAEEIAMGLDTVIAVENKLVVTNA